jgi:membrane-associated phospholipid phosphatase
MKNNPAFSTFLSGYVVLFLLGIWGVACFDKGSLVLWSNHLHQPYLDQFFKYLTYLGDGMALAVLCLAFCFYRYKYAILLTGIGVAQLLAAFVAKKIIFGKTMRPAGYFENREVLHFVAGVRMHHWYTFPSGHSITVFGLLFFIALVNEKRNIAVACLLVASLVAFSRVYLAQHFLADILAGSALGIGLTGSIYYLAYHWQPFWYSDPLNRPMA